ncbi:MAG TPA: APC family permease [Myxococcales bacterium]|jgi:amino acid transporter|nr:APC family permease [Myxococcales bacterium]
MTSPASDAAPAEAAARRLTLLDCVAIGVNGIVGSGIYLLLAPLAARAGAASVVGLFACGALCIAIALCFAELGGMFDRSGGTYVYAQAAFGRAPGFAVGCMSTATGVLAFAAVSRGFAEALGAAVPALDPPAKSAVAVGLIAFFSAVNAFGVKAGARTSDALMFIKMLPLLALAAGGLAFVRADAVAGMLRAPSTGSWGGAVAGSAFLAVFMYSGFEFVAVPAGEAKDARRTVPLAILGSLVGSMALYCVVQLVAVSVLPDLASRAHPLMDVAAAIAGEKARAVLWAASLVSMLGFTAGSALVAPRYFTALAEDGYLPRALTSRNRWGAPGVAIAFSAALASALALWAGYGSLVDVSNVALFGQYIPAALAVPVLRWRRPDAPRRYALPGGPLIPVVAFAGSAALLWAASPRAEEWLFSAKVLGVGAIVWGTTAAVSRGLASRARTG